MRIERILLIGFLFALMLMALTAIVPFEIASSTEAVRLTLRASIKRGDLLEHTLSLMKDVESGHRGFVITGREDFLDSYHAALTGLANDRISLKQSTFSTQDKATIAELLQVVDRKLELADTTINLRRTSGFEPVQKILSSGIGKQLMDKIRHLVAPLLLSEQRIRLALQEDLDQRTKLGARVGLAATIFNILLLGTAIIILFRINAQRLRVSDSLRKTRDELRLGLGELERRNREISILSQLARALESPVSMQETVSIINVYCTKLFPATSGVLYLFRNSRDLLEKEGEWGNAHDQPDILELKDCWALRRGQPHVVNKVGELTCHHQRFQNADDTSICLPLTAQGEVLGLITIQRAADAVPKEFSAIEIELTVTLSEQIALGLSNVRLREILRHQSIVDPLTGLFNRRYMDETIARELARSRRNGVPLSMLLLDVDHFKKVNDAYGHDAGDAVLRALAHCLKNNVRESDVVCRFGGEEIVLILPECDRNTALQRAEGILAAVRQLDVKYGPQQIGRITISIGIATYPDDGLDVEALLLSADRAMYTAKNTGRDRIVTAG